MGISAPRPVSGQKLLHQHFAVGGNHGSAGAISEAAAETGSGAAALSLREKRFHFRHAVGSTTADAENESAANHYANELSKPVLERFATTRASRGWRL